MGCASSKSARAAETGNSSEQAPSGTSAQDEGVVLSQKNRRGLQSSAKIAPGSRPAQTGKSAPGNTGGENSKKETNKEATAVNTGGAPPGNMGPMQQPTSPYPVQRGGPVYSPYQQPYGYGAPMQQNQNSGMAQGMLMGAALGYGGATMMHGGGMGMMGPPMGMGGGVMGGGPVGGAVGLMGASNNLANDLNFGDSF